MLQWTVSASSQKSSNVPGNILDIHDLTTFWQSDGALPHEIALNVFHQFCVASHLDIYFEYSSDESYCPSTILVYAGEHPNMLLVQILNELIDLGCW